MCRFAGYPGNYNRFFGLRSEECNNGGCLIELAQQLGVIMIGKQVINNAQEIVVPKLKGYFHRQFRARFSKKVERTPWEEDYELIENEGLFEEYLEMSEFCQNVIFLKSVLVLVNIVPLKTF